MSKAEIKLELDELNNGSLNLYENGSMKGEMVLNKTDGKLFALHTEVVPKSRGKGFAKQLFGKMVAYAREHELKIVPVCPFVQKELKRNADEYSDVWKKDAH